MSGIRCTGSRPLRKSGKQVLFRYLDGRKEYHYVEGEPACYSLIRGIDKDKMIPVVRMAMLKGKDIKSIYGDIVCFRRVYVPIEGRVLKTIEYHEIDSLKG